MCLSLVNCIDFISLVWDDKLVVCVLDFIGMAFVSWIAWERRKWVEQWIYIILCWLWIHLTASCVLPRFPYNGGLGLYANETISPLKLIFSGYFFTVIEKEAKRGALWFFWINMKMAPYLNRAPCWCKSWYINVFSSGVSQDNASETFCRETVKLRLLL